MKQIFIKAKAKINLTLNILDTREDGYHELESIFQNIYLYDEIHIEKCNKPNIQIICNNELLQKDNIINKAYYKLKENYTQITGIVVKLKKKIPIEAGLGGGSSDCAYFILAMNTLFNLNMTKDALIELGSLMGADVVPCMIGDTILGKGLGEKTTTIQDNTKYYIILIKPNISFSTKTMFEKYDTSKKFTQKNNNKNMINALRINNISDISKNLYNVFEKTIKNEDKIFECKRLLEKLGAKGTLMTGSGSSVFGIFEDKQTAKQAYYKIKEEKQVYFCVPYHYNNLKKILY